MQFQFSFVVQILDIFVTYCRIHFDYYLISQYISRAAYTIKTYTQTCALYIRCDASVCSVVHDVPSKAFSFDQRHKSMHARHGGHFALILFYYSAHFKINIRFWRFIGGLFRVFDLCLSGITERALMIPIIAQSKYRIYIVHGAQSPRGTFGFLRCLTNLW